MQVQRQEIATGFLAPFGERPLRHFGSGRIGRKIVKLGQPAGVGDGFNIENENGLQGRALFLHPVTAAVLNVKSGGGFLYVALCKGGADIAFPFGMAVCFGDIFIERRTILIFHDPGDGKPIERLTVSRYGLGGLFAPAWDPGKHADQWQSVADIISARDPAKIAINTSDLYRARCCTD